MLHRRLTTPPRPLPAASSLSRVPQGIAAEARCYNVIISACSKAGQPAAALAVYERMLADGVQVGEGTAVGALQLMLPLPQLLLLPLLLP